MRIVIWAALAALVSSHSAAEACSTCITGITGPAGERLTGAFNWSVFFLMAMPYAIVFTVVGFFLFAYRRAAKKARAAQPRTEETPVLNPVSDLP